VSHYYASSDCESLIQGFVELLEVRDPIQLGLFGRSSVFILHSYLSDRGSIWWECPSLKEAARVKKAFFKWHWADVTPESVPVLEGRPTQNAPKADPWFYKEPQAA
jgi:hypothetical protein